MSDTFHGRVKTGSSSPQRYWGFAAIAAFYWPIFSVSTRVLSAAIRIRFGNLVTCIGGPSAGFFSSASADSRRLPLVARRRWR